MSLIKSCGIYAKRCRIRNVFDSCVTTGQPTWLDCYTKQQTS
jgi:hypothetical protein